ncbi:MAG: D-alanyl-D-alanine carboxypeptidase, partial [Succinivibrio sp.]
FNGIKQYNRNRLLWDKSINVDGIKTGHLSEVGYNLVTSAVNGDMRLVSAVIGCKSDKDRANSNKALLTYGFRYFEYYNPLKAGKILNREIRMGKKNSVDLMLEKDVSLLIPRGSQSEIKVGYKLKSSVFKAPVKKGDVMGVIEVVLNNKVIATSPLVSAETIDECGFFGRMWDKVLMYFESDDEASDNANAGK